MGEEFVSQYGFESMGIITAAQAALGTDKSAATTHALAAAGLARKKLPAGTQAAILRFLCTADGEAQVINVYAMYGDNDHYHLAGTWSLTGGKQVDGTIGVFVDTVAVSGTTEVWPSIIVESSDANDSIATLALKTHGVSNLLVIATTLGSTQLKVEVARIVL